MASARIIKRQRLAKISNCMGPLLSIAANGDVEIRLQGWRHGFSLRRGEIPIIRAILESPDLQAIAEYARASNPSSAICESESNA